MGRQRFDVQAVTGSENSDSMTRTMNRRYSIDEADILQDCIPRSQYNQSPLQRPVVRATEKLMRVNYIVIEMEKARRRMKPGSESKWATIRWYKGLLSTQTARALSCALSAALVLSVPVAQCHLRRLRSPSVGQIAESFLRY